jgi:hypothetical protein
MYKRVFKQKGSRVYRARYRLSNGPQTFDVPLRTDKKHVAEAKLAKLIREQEEELSGLLAPKPLRSAASKPIAEHLSNYVAHLGALSCKPKHLAFTRNRITRLCEECDWRLLRDISADGFNHWRAAQTALGPKTCNHYLGHISGFLTWLVANGRLSHHPLKTVAKAETRGLERCVRRALTDSESDRLIQSPGGRGLIYFASRRCKPLYCRSVCNHEEQQDRSATACAEPYRCPQDLPRAGTGNRGQDVPAWYAAF